MGRLGWATILGCVLGAILFGVLQRGCRLDAGSGAQQEPIARSLPESFGGATDRENQVRAAPARSGLDTPPPTRADTSLNASQRQLLEERRNARAGRRPTPTAQLNVDELQRDRIQEARERLEQLRAERERNRTIQNASAEAQRLNNQSQQASSQPRNTTAVTVQPTNTDVGGTFTPAGSPLTPRLAAPSARSGEGAADGFSGDSLNLGGEGGSEGADRSSDSSSRVQSGGDGLINTTGGGGFAPAPNPGDGSGGEGDGDGDGDPGSGDGGGETPDPTPPGEFGLLTPQNGAVDLLLAQTLNWEASNGAESYLVEISTDAGFAGVAYSETVVDSNSLQLPEDLLVPGQQYHWRVRAINDDGEQDAETFAFSTLAAPGAFSAASPSPGERGLVGAVTLEWAESTGAATYSLVVARDEALTDTVLAEAGLESPSLEIDPALLEEGVTYFWRATAVNAVASVAMGTSASSFTMLGPPGLFALISPQDGAEDLLVVTPLVWSPSSDADTYRVEVATDSAFQDRVVNRETQSPSLALTGADIEPGRTYYWRVSAVNELDVTASLPVAQSFSTAPGPGAFALSSPLNGGSASLPVTLDWEDSERAALYQVQIASESAFQNILLDELIIPQLDGSSMQVPDGVLQQGGTYFWRVLASNEATFAAQVNVAAVVSPFSFTVGVADYDVNGDGVIDVRDMYSYRELSPLTDLNIDGVVNDSDRLDLRNRARQNEPADLRNAR